MSRRVIGGQQSLEGEHIGKLLIGQPVSLAPLKYQTTCERCGTVANVSHVSIRNGSARCLNNGCGKDAVREASMETLGKFRRRLSAVERKRESEKQVRLSAAQRQAEEDITSTSRKIAATVAERVSKIPDDEVYISPEVASLRMPKEEAQSFNAAQAAIFMREFREYDAYRNDANLDAIADYFERNGIKLATSEMIRRAFVRLRNCGLLTPNPVTQPRPSETAVQQYVTPVIPTPESQAEVLPEGSEMGYDPHTGEQRPFTKREIDALSADQFRRVFRVYRDALTLPNRIW